MKEDRVDAKPIVVDAKPALTAKECEVIAQFQKEVGKMLDKRRLQVRFRVFILKIEELENERVFDRFFGRHRITISRFLSLASIAALFFERAKRS